MTGSDLTRNTMTASAFMQSDAGCAAPNDTRVTAVMSIIGLCVYFPPLAVPVGAIAAGAAIAATRKHLAV